MTPRSRSARELAARSGWLALASWLVFGAAAVPSIVTDGNFVIGNHGIGLLLFLALLVVVGGSIAAVVAGHRALRVIKTSGGEGKRRAQGGLVGGYLLIAAVILTFPLTLFMLIYSMCDPSSLGSCS